MKRSEFLKSWESYPAAPSGCSDASRPVTDGWVGGRYGGLALHSAGARLALDLSDQTKWIEILREGDVIAVRFAQGRVAEVRLLAPALDSFALQSQFDNATSTKWAQFTSNVRAFFSSREFTEALTPTLVPSPGTEPFLDAFSTKWEIGSEAREFFLPTSPEFHLKKMLVAGWTRIFEIRNCFRNGEIGEHHQPEFSMLEWYRAYADLDAIALDMEELLRDLGAGELKRTTMSALFAENFGGFVLQPTTTRDELAALAARSGTRIDADDTWDEIFFRLFLEHIEAKLGLSQPLLVRGYPPSQAALSRIGADGFADRFEIYWRGMELANAFHELNDPHENAKRFEQDAEGKKVLGKPAVPVDQDLLQALRHGLPPSGGVALGMDRLFMALNEIASIGDTRAFPVVR